MRVVTYTFLAQVVQARALSVSTQICLKRSMAGAEREMMLCAQDSTGFLITEESHCRGVDKVLVELKLREVTAVEGSPGTSS